MGRASARVGAWLVVLSLFAVAGSTLSGALAGAASAMPGAPTIISGRARRAAGHRQVQGPRGPQRTDRRLPRDVHGRGRWRQRYECRPAVAGCRPRADGRTAVHLPGRRTDPGRDRAVLRAVAGRRAHGCAGKPATGSAERRPREGGGRRGGGSVQPGHEERWSVRDALPPRGARRRPTASSTTPGRRAAPRSSSAICSRPPPIRARSWPETRQAGASTRRRPTRW